MKLSDIKGDRTFEVLADLVDPVCNIAADKGITLFQRVKPPEGVDARAFAMGRVRKQLPLLLRNHKHDICTILASIKGVPRKEFVEQLNLGGLVLDLADLVNDGEFVAFFTSAQTATSSGSAPENTEAPKK